MLLALRGTPFLYTGDELALENGEVPPERMLDSREPSRDPGRTPMPWTREGGWREPWLPLSDTSRNVEEHMADPGSTLHYTRDLIALRRRLPDLRTGGYSELPAPASAWAWQRGEDVFVAVNLGTGSAEIDGVEGTIALATVRARDHERVSGRLRLGPAEGAVVTRQATSD